MTEEQIRRQIEKYYEERSGYIIHAAVYALINTVLWGIWAMFLNVFPVTWPWPIVVSLGWGAGLVAHTIDLWSKSPGRITRVRRAAARRMTQIYGADWQASVGEDDYQRIWKATWKEAQDTSDFAIHLGVYTSINLMIWIIWLGITRGAGIPFPPLAVMGLWGVGLAAHGLSVFFDSSRAVVARQQAIERAMERYHEVDLAPALAEKPKRKRTRHILTDDGELLEVAEADEQDDYSQERRHGV
jgi:hypothetical protein